MNDETVFPSEHQITAGKLTVPQLEILQHTSTSAANKRYCGDSADMQRLVSLQLMRSCGKVSWCPDEYFTITEQGEQVLWAAYK